MCTRPGPVLLGDTVHAHYAGSGEVLAVERLWRSLKYEEVYLHAYETVGAVREGVALYMTFYNQLSRIARLTVIHRIACTLTT